jgi:hypothetical protein
MDHERAVTLRFSDIDDINLKEEASIFFHIFLFVVSIIVVGILFELVCHCEHCRY